MKGLEMDKTQINKALDLNKLFIDQRKGKLLKKQVDFPIYSPPKYDGNYVAVIIYMGLPKFVTSGGLVYKHLDGGGDIFFGQPDGVYLAERIWGEGKLGDRNKCNLKGPKDNQTSTGHNYKIFDYLTLSAWYEGKSGVPYVIRADILTNRFNHNDLAGIGKLIVDQRELDEHLHSIVKLGYEGVMVIHPKWKWKDTSSRKIDMCKYKKRPTVDLLCVGVEEGTGKYEGMIGSLVLVDSKQRTVSVGSGMSDCDRHQSPDHYIGKVVEMFYEQIVDTYIQPTFGAEYEGVLVRHDKTHEEID